MKRYMLMLVLFTFALCGCGGDNGDSDFVVPPKPTTVDYIYTLVTEPTGHVSSWYELRQYFGIDKDVPKYSGAFGTYTYKHRPVSVTGNGDTYTTYSDNSSGDLQIFIYKNNEEPVLVHTEINQKDAHQNSAISIDKDGYIWLHVAARGYKRTASVYKSIEPYSLEFEEAYMDSYESYPQIHETIMGHSVFYTRYDRVSDNGVNWGVERSLNFKVLGVKTRLVNGGHYQISTYANSVLYSVYDYHPDSNVDKRTNISIIKSEDYGTTWTNLAGKPLELPLVTDDKDALVYDAEALGKYVYLKDVIVDKEGKLRISFVESDSGDPTTGTRYNKEWVDGEVITLGATTHNFNSGVYLEDKDDLYLVTTGMGICGYSGGSLELHRQTDEGWVLEDTVDDYNYSFARRTLGGNLTGVVSVGASDIDAGGEQYHFHIAKEEIVK